MLPEVRRRVRSAVAIAALCAAVVAGDAAAALAQGRPDPSPDAASPPASSAPATGAVSWSVQPATATGADGRVWAELTLKPGGSADQYLELRNLGKEPAVFSLSAADGYFTQQGRFNMLPAGVASKDAGLWVHIQPTIQLDAGQSAIVPYTVTVPDGATPGDHAAGVAASVTSVGLNKSGAQVGVVSRVGFRVMTRVTGAYRTSATGEVTGSYHPVWNPFQPGRVDVGYTLKNAGNTRVSMTARIRLSGPFGLGARSQKAPAVAELDPGESRSGVIAFEGVWPVGILTASLDSGVTPVLKHTATTRPASPIRISTSVPALPWSQLIVLVIAALVVLGLMYDRRRRQRSIRKQIAAAREEGRREVSV